jgi:hypothetical protein
VSLDKLGPSKNIHNTTPKKMGFLDQMKVFSMLIIVTTLVYVSLIIWYRELGRPIFLEAIFGLTQLLATPVNVAEDSATTSKLTNQLRWTTKNKFVELDLPRPFPYNEEKGVSRPREMCFRLKEGVLLRTSQA